MKRLIPLLFLATTVSASYSGYTYQSVITISSTNVSNVLGTVNNFPVLVSTNMPQISTTTGSSGQLNSTGMDLVFSSMSDCSFLLHWDTETVQNVGVSTFNAWVNIPVLTTATLTAATFYMCWGNSGITTYQGISTSTWDSNYAAVWHFPNGKTLNFNDSTSNGLNTSAATTVAASTGMIDGSLSFSGGNGVNTGNVAVGTSITLSAWVNPSSFNGNGDFVFSQQQNDGGFPSGDNWQLTSSPAGSGTPPRMLVVNSGTFDDVSAGSSLSAGTWYYLVGSYDGSTIKIYLNNVLTSKSSPGTLSNVSQPIYIGRGFNLDGFSFNGLIDEARVSNIARNSDWITTEYNNQNSPSVFLIVGPEATNTIPPVSFTRGLDILGAKVSIRGGKVSVQ